MSDHDKPSPAERLAGAMLGAYEREVARMAADGVRLDPSDLDDACELVCDSLSERAERLAVAMESADGEQD